MNAAARLVHQRALARHLVFINLLSRKQLSVLLLAMSVVFSSLAVIYVTHVNRVMHAEYQYNVAEKNHLFVERGQLLLERGTWMMQSRIQRFAEGELGMIMPNHKSVVIIRE